VPLKFCYGGKVFLADLALFSIWLLVSSESGIRISVGGKFYICDYHAVSFVHSLIHNQLPYASNHPGKVIKRAQFYEIS
jgi:hypothetical protein